MQILTEALDGGWGADLAKKMGGHLGIKVDILAGEGHMISKTIASVLKKFIGQISCDSACLQWLTQY